MAQARSSESAILAGSSPRARVRTLIRTHANMPKRALAGSRFYFNRAAISGFLLGYPIVGNRGSLSPRSPTSNTKGPSAVRPASLRTSVWCSFKSGNRIQTSLRTHRAPSEEGPASPV